MSELDDNLIENYADEIIKEVTKGLQPFGTMGGQLRYLYTGDSKERERIADLLKKFKEATLSSGVLDEEKREELIDILIERWVPTYETFFGCVEEIPAYQLEHLKHQQKGVIFTKHY